MKIETINPPRSNGDCYRTLEDFRIDGSAVGAPDLHVREGFEFDGASVPRAFWLTTFPPGDTRVLEAACGHDFLYRRHPPCWTRRKADRWFLWKIRRDGVPLVHALRAYIGLRIGGFIAWRKGGRGK
jgi:hypothetical protein